MEVNQTLYQAVKESSLDRKHNTAVYYKGKKISFSKLIKKIDLMANVLVNNFNISKGDTVLVAQPNIPEVLIVTYALNKIGAVTNLVHPFTPYNQLSAIYKKTNSKLAILFEQRIAKEVEQYRGFAGNLVVTRIEDYLPLPKKVFYHVFMNKAIRRKLGKWRGKFDGFKYLCQFKKGKNEVIENNNNSNEAAIMLHSGSTTGDPKTIMLSNDAFNFIANDSYDFVCLNREQLKGTVMLSVLPSFHGFGFCMTMHTPLCLGFGVALVPKFTTTDVVEVMNKNKMVCACGIPGIYEALLSDSRFANNKRLKYLHICFSGGDSMSASLKDRWDTQMKNSGSYCQLFEGYGLTEAIAVNCVNNFTHNKPGSIGYPINGVDFAIIDEKENILPPYSVGEICMKSGAVMLRYFDNEEATKATFTKSGYLKTGDLGYIDDEGFVFYKQRQKRVIKVSGVGVFPSEIERLIESVPGVNKCCAISIPDSKLVHAVKVFVVATYFDEEGMKRSIMDTCQKYLIRWSVPKEIEFVKELPTTLLGKVDFVKLQKQEDALRGIKHE